LARSSSSSKNPQQPQQQQQQRAPGETKEFQLGDKIDFVPADWLYSESLTKSTKKEAQANTYFSKA
jgi:hypothetical protein